MLLLSYTVLFHFSCTGLLPLYFFIYLQDMTLLYRLGNSSCKPEWKFLFTPFSRGTTVLQWRWERGNDNREQEWAPQSLEQKKIQDSKEKTKQNKGTKKAHRNNGVRIRFPPLYGSQKWFYTHEIIALCTYMKIKECIRCLNADTIHKTIGRTTIPYYNAGGWGKQNCASDSLKNTELLWLRFSKK